MANITTIRNAYDKLMEQIEARLSEIGDIENRKDKHDDQESALEEFQSGIEAAWEDFESSYTTE